MFQIVTVLAAAVLRGLAADRLARLIAPALVAHSPLPPDDCGVCATLLALVAIEGAALAWEHFRRHGQ